MAQHSDPSSTQGASLTTRGQQYHPLELFRRELDSLFDRFFGGGWLAPFEEGFGQTRSRGFDVDEKEQEVVVRADLPGLEEDELDVRLDNDMLAVRTEKEQKGPDRREYRRFFRRMMQPPGIDAAKVQASNRNGVLELHIPKPEGSQAKRIPIRSQQATTDQASGGEQSSKGAKK